jgi:hypothetical protein
MRHRFGNLGSGLSLVVCRLRLVRLSCRFAVLGRFGGERRLRVGVLMLRNAVLGRGRLRVCRLGFDRWSGLKGVLLGPGRIGLGFLRLGQGIGKLLGQGIGELGGIGPRLLQLGGGFRSGGIGGG